MGSPYFWVGKDNRFFVPGKLFIAFIRFIFLPFPLLLALQRTSPFYLNRAANIDRVIISASSF